MPDSAGLVFKGLRFLLLQMGEDNAHYPGLLEG